MSSLDNEGRATDWGRSHPRRPLKFGTVPCERLEGAMGEHGRTDTLIVMGGAVLGISVVAACFGI